MDYNDFKQLLSLYQSGNLGQFNQPMGFNPMTGFGGQVPESAQKGAGYNKLFQAQNSPMEQQRRAKFNANAAYDKLHARQVGWDAYQNLNKGPMGLEALTDLLGKMSKNQSFRNQKVQGFDSLWA